MLLIWANNLAYANREKNLIQWFVTCGEEKQLAEKYWIVWSKSQRPQ